jgi:hypothetical protein
MAAGIRRIEAAPTYRPLWNSAQILVGNSPMDQIPSAFIQCPMFSDDGHFADAFHTLDLSDLPTTGKVRGAVTHHNDTIEPDLASATAVAVTEGTDGILYLLVGGEGKVAGARGYFRGVTKAIVRCKYKAANQNGNLLLIACVDCALILIRD